MVKGEMRMIKVTRKPKTNLNLEVGTSVALRHIWAWTGLGKMTWAGAESLAFTVRRMSSIPGLGLRRLAQNRLRLGRMTCVVVWTCADWVSGSQEYMDDTFWAGKTPKAQKMSKS